MWVLYPATKILRLKTFEENRNIRNTGILREERLCGFCSLRLVWRRSVLLWVYVNYIWTYWAPWRFGLFSGLSNIVVGECRWWISINKYLRWGRYTGFVATHEGYFYVMDPLPLWIAITIYCFIWPSRYIKEYDGDSTSDEAGVAEVGMNGGNSAEGYELANDKYNAQKWAEVMDR